MNNNNSNTVIGDLLTTKTSRIMIDQIALEIFDSQSHGDAIVIVHGNSGSINLFSNLYQSDLAKDYRLIGVHLPGHGNSELGSELSIPYLAKLISHLLEVLKLERYLLVGQSIGGHVLSHALPALSKCRGLVLVSAPPLSLNTMAKAFKPDPVDGALFTADLSPEQIHLMADKLLGPQKDNEQAYVAMLDAISKCEGGFRQSLGESLAQGKLADEQKHILASEVPVALIWGTEDAFIYPEYYWQAQLSQTLGEGKYQIEGAGHHPHLSEQLDFVELIRGFALELELNVEQESVEYEYPSAAEQPA
tara:strand:- start:16635 stop:17549 length:915 start_codon:yes stop_codon:yes gene_type:complete